MPKSSFKFNKLLSALRKQVAAELKKSKRIFLEVPKKYDSIK